MSLETLEQLETSAEAPPAWYNRWLEKDLVLDRLIRLGIRRLLRERLREESRGGVESQAARLAAFVERLRTSRNRRPDPGGQPTALRGARGVSPMHPGTPPQVQLLLVATGRFDPRRIRRSHARPYGETRPPGGWPNHSGTGLRLGLVLALCR